MEIATRRVKKGAAYLDRHHKGWHNEIDIHTLDLSDGQCCVIGQLAGEFLFRVQKFFSAYTQQDSLKKAEELGMYSEVECPTSNYSKLTHCWQIEIQLRRARETYPWKS
jgi:hypothetical protein